MTSYYRYIDNKTLLKDRKLIIFAESIRYCREKGEDCIRYSKLKELCDDKLANLTEGKEDFGGGFEYKIGKITDKLNPKHEQYMIRDKRSNRVTNLYPNIPLMLSYLEKKRVNPDPSMNHTIEVRGIREEPIIIEEKLEAKVRRGGMGEFATIS